MAIGATVLVKDVLFQASTLLLDVTPTSQFVRWSERELVGFLNDAQRAIVKYMPIANARTDVVRLLPGSRQSIAAIPAAAIKPGDGSMQATPVRGLILLDIVRNMGSDGASPGAPIRVVPRETLDNVCLDWHTQTARAVEHFMFDPRLPQTFYVWPAVPPQSPVWVEMAYAAHPDEIPFVPAGAYGKDSSSTLTISLADTFVDDLVNYVVARAFLKDAEVAGNAQSAQLYTQLFTASLNAQVQALTGENPNLAFLPFAPAPQAQAR